MLGVVPLDCHVSGPNLLSYTHAWVWEGTGSILLPFDFAMVIWIVLFLKNHGGLVGLLTGASVRTNNREWLTRLNFAKDNTILL